MIDGTGLRQDVTLQDGFVYPNGGPVPSYVQVNLGLVQNFSVFGVNGLPASTWSICSTSST